MSLELFSTAYFTNPFHQSVCMFIPLIMVRQRLGKHVPAAKIMGGVVFCTVNVVQKER
jgi:hypothetical protein